MYKRVIVCTAVLCLITALFSTQVFADSGTVTATVGVGSITATMNATDKQDDITIRVDPFESLFTAGSSHVPGMAKTGTLTIVNNSGFEYDVVDYALTATLAKPQNLKRINNSAVKNAYKNMAYNDVRTAVLALTPDAWWKLCDDYYKSVYGDNWTSNDDAVSDLLGYGSTDQGNTFGSGTGGEPQQIIDLATKWMTKKCYLSFNQSGTMGVPVGWTDGYMDLTPNRTIDAYVAKTNKTFVLSCFSAQHASVLAGANVYNIGYSMDGPRLGNVYPGACQLEISFTITLSKKAALAKVDALSVLEDPNTTYGAGDTMEINLKQDGVVKYTYVMNQSNNWHAPQQIVTPGVYALENASIPAKYTPVSLTATSGYDVLTKQVTVFAGNVITVKQTNRISGAVVTPVIPVIPQTGDQYNLYTMLFLFIAAAAALPATVLLYKRKRARQ